ncbi:hypothetical protein K227x_10390 [Rubripirellula lacrimiformis]|uniref:Uncharacterized protein n=1 Tax=Rubripirellula lacrimiformis TaxID=1930273 RepID=A0A517N6B5_9BACT|nr:hypothetical protein K227x_10390 [Rubripirellula lacrimiformis]
MSLLAIESDGGNLDAKGTGSAKLRCGNDGAPTRAGATLRLWARKTRYSVEFSPPKKTSALPTCLAILP